MKSNHPSDDLIIAFSLDEIDPDQHESIAAHIADCDLCSQTVASLSRALEGYRNAPLPAASANTLVKLLEAQAVHAARGRAFWSSLNPFRLVPALALFAILFLAGFVTGRGSLFTPMGKIPSPVHYSASEIPPKRSEQFLFHAVASEATLPGGRSDSTGSPVSSSRDSL